MEFDPIILKYDGLDAARNEIEIFSLGQSLQGAAQLLGSSAHVVLTGDYAKTALDVRILAGVPRQGSWELPALIVTVAPIVTPMLPIFAEAGKVAAKKAVTSVVSYVVEKVASKGGKSDVQAALSTVEKAMAELGHTSRHAIDAVERIAANQQPAVRLMVAPVGRTCTSVQVGEPEDGAVVIDPEKRSQIEFMPTPEIRSASKFEVLLSELDLKNHSCKFAMKSESDPEKRISGQITDPILQNPDNPYSTALSKQNWLTVIAKPQFEDGELDKLFISDVVS